MEIARERIKQLRLECGESQQIVADANGVDRSSYARYEDGSRRLPSVVVASLARYYGVSSDYILGLTNERTVNMELRAVCEYTGLNESAVQILCQRKTDQRFFSMLRFMLVNQKLLDMLSGYLFPINNDGRIEFAELLEYLPLLKRSVISFYKDKYDKKEGAK